MGGTTTARTTTASALTLAIRWGTTDQGWQVRTTAGVGGGGAASDGGDNDRHAG